MRERERIISAFCQKMRDVRVSELWFDELYAHSYENNMCHKYALQDMVYMSNTVLEASHLYLLPFKSH
jgi:hypothetical protein